MWKFLGRLFGSSESTTEAVRAVRDGLDAIWHTDEEKAQERAADVTEARKVLLEWVKNSQGQNLARRVIALAITGSWLLLKFVGVGLAVTGVWVSDAALTTFERVQQSVDIIGGFAADMTPAVMLILGFYFAAPHMGRIAEAALQNFGGRNK